MGCFLKAVAYEAGEEEGVLGRRERSKVGRENDESGEPPKGGAGNLSDKLTVPNNGKPWIMQGSKKSRVRGSTRREAKKKEKEESRAGTGGGRGEKARERAPRKQEEGREQARG